MEWLSKVKVINKDLARFKESLQFVVYAFYIIVGIFHDDVAFYAFFCVATARLPGGGEPFQPRGGRSGLALTGAPLQLPARGLTSCSYSRVLFSTFPLQVQGLLVECWAPAATARPSPREIELFLQRKVSPKNYKQ